MACPAWFGDALGCDDVVAQVQRSLAQGVLGVDAEQALRDRALSLRSDILVAEGVPEAEVGSH